MIRRNSIIGDERAAISIEMGTVIGLLILLSLFIVDAMLVLHRYSVISDVNTRIVRYVSMELGKAWDSKTIDGAPWNRNCGSFIADKVDDFLASTHLGDASAGDSTSLYYFGKTIDENKALLVVPPAPYAILRLQGRVRGGCVLCTLFTRDVITTETSMLVEFDLERCDDY